MRYYLKCVLVTLVALSAAGCMGTKHYQGPGRYMVQGPGYHIVGGPYPDSGGCHQAVPQAQHGQTYVCLYMPRDVRSSLWKKSS